MNHVTLMGRLTREPEYHEAKDASSVPYTRYTLAVDRRGAKKDSKETADFVPCVVFGKAAEFVKNYLHKGNKIALEGRLQTHSYTNKDGQKVFSMVVVVLTQEFAESKKAEGGNTAPAKPAQQAAPAQNAPAAQSTPADDFMTAPEDADDYLPFA